MSQLCLTGSSGTDHWHGGQIVPYSFTDLKYFSFNRKYFHLLFNTVTLYKFNASWTGQGSIIFLNYLQEFHSKLKGFHCQPNCTLLCKHAVGIFAVHKTNKYSSTRTYNCRKCEFLKQSILPILLTVLCNFTQFTKLSKITHWNRTFFRLLILLIV